MSKHITLNNISLTKLEREMLLDYCSELGYVLDEEPDEFNGQFPIIYKDIKKKKKVFIQRYQGRLKFVYSISVDDFETIYSFLKNCKHSKHSKKLRFLYEIGQFLPEKLSLYSS